MQWTKALQTEYLKKIRVLLAVVVVGLVLLLISVWLHRKLVIVLSLAVFGASSYSWWLLRESILGRK